MFAIFWQIVLLERNHLPCDTLRNNKPGLLSWLYPTYATCYIEISRLLFYVNSIYSSNGGLKRYVQVHHAKLPYLMFNALVHISDRQAGQRKDVRLSKIFSAMNIGDPIISLGET